MSEHFYNEHNAYRAAVLRERIADGLLPEGVVDERNIEEIPDETFSRYRHIHLFAGIGGFPFGMRLAGFPESISIVDGGFPCQDISNAGKRAGITGSRSGLWREMVRCVRVVRPQYVFVENVAALLCRGMGEVLGDLAEIGYDADGDCISAADVGAPHLRRRIWIVAYPIGGGVRQQSIAERWRGGETVIEHAGEIPNAEVRRAGKLSAGSRRSGETAIDVDGHGETLADAGKMRRGQSAATAASAGKSFHPTEREESPLGIGSGGEDVANAAQRGFAMCREPSGIDRLPTCGSEAVAHANGGRCEQRHAGERSVPEFDQGSICDAEHGGREGRDAMGPRANATLPSGRWPVEPNVGRVAHGVPKRVDRLAALGDAIVPQCVQEVIRRRFTL